MENISYTRNYTKGKSFQFSLWNPLSAYSNNPLQQDFVLYNTKMYACMKDVPMGSTSPDKDTIHWLKVIEGVKGDAYDITEDDYVKITELITNSEEYAAVINNLNTFLNTFSKQENLRQENESDRVSNENERNTAESIRISNENERIANEAERVSNYDILKSDTEIAKQAAVSSANDVKEIHDALKEQKILVAGDNVTLTSVSDIRTKISSKGGTAEDTTFEGKTSNLSASNVQEAIDELHKFDEYLETVNSLSYVQPSGTEYATKEWVESQKNQFSGTIVLDGNINGTTIPNNVTLLTSNNIDNEVIETINNETFSLLKTTSKFLPDAINELREIILLIKSTIGLDDNYQLSSDSNIVDDKFILKSESELASMYEAGTLDPNKIYFGY